MDVFMRLSNGENEEFFFWNCRVMLQSVECCAWKDYYLKWAKLCSLLYFCFIFFFGSFQKRMEFYECINACTGSSNSYTNWYVHHIDNEFVHECYFIYSIPHNVNVSMLFDGSGNTNSLRFTIISWGWSICRCSFFFYFSYYL